MFKNILMIQLPSGRADEVRSASGCAGPAGVRRPRRIGSLVRRGQHVALPSPSLAAAATQVPESTETGSLSRRRGKGGRSLRPCSPAVSPRTSIQGKR